jgi:hypothetical protein
MLTPGDESSTVTAMSTVPCVLTNAALLYKLFSSWKERYTGFGTPFTVWIPKPLWYGVGT